MYIGHLGMCSEPDCIEDAEVRCPHCGKAFCPYCLRSHACQRPEHVEPTSLIEPLAAAV